MNNIIPIPLIRAESNVISAWLQFQEATGHQVDIAIEKMDEAVAHLYATIHEFESVLHVPVTVSEKVNDILVKWELNTSSE